MTNKEAVAFILGGLKITKDTRVSPRYILRVLRNVAETYIAQRLTERTILQELNLFSNIDCFEFEKEDLVKCPDVSFRRCKVMMKSKKPLPKPVFGRKAGIRNITSIDDLESLRIIDDNQFRRNLKRKHKTEETQVFLSTDGHLRIPDKEIFSVNLDVVTLETDMVDECSSCGENSCKSGWDYEFICPDKLKQAVFTQALQIITSTYGGIPEDTNPNGIDKQQTL